MNNKQYPARMHEILTKPGEPPLKSGEMFALNTDPYDMDYYLTDDGDMFLRYGTANKTVRMAHADEVLDAINHGITRRPKLSEEQVAQLKALVTLGYRWLIKDSTDAVFAYTKMPAKQSEWWNCGGANVRIFIDLPPGILTSLVSWSDPAPLDIVQTLRDAGVEVEVE